MAGKDKKLEIRFTGFTDAWEQRKYSETFTKIPNNTLSRAELNYNSGLAKNVHYGDVLIKFGELLDVEKDEIPYITDGATVNKFKSSKLQSGDVIIADAAEDETVGKCTELVNVCEETVISGLHTIPCRPTLSFVSGYLGYFMNSPAYHTQLLRLMQGTKVTSISKAALQDTSIFYPIDSVEQCKISKLFQQLNNLITLHQRKCDKLVIVKKSMLEKMFPKSGANVPEIRFKGFTGIWEQNKLNYYIETSNEKNASNSFTKDDVLSVSGDFGIVNQIEFQGRSFAGVSVSNYGIVNIGDIVYTKSPLKANPYGIIKTNKGKAGIVSTLYAIYHPKEMTNSNFVQCYFESDYRLNRYLKPLVNKGAKNDMKVTDDNALLGLVIFPSYDEQTKIAGLFEHLDHLITLHQRELEKLKNIKKSMLEKMFV